MPTGARLARRSDAPAIAEVQQRAWRAQFADVLPGHVLDTLDLHALADQWASSIQQPPTPNHRVLVAIEGDAGSGDSVIGYAAIGPDDAGDAHTGELLDLVIDPSITRRGHGSRLMQAAVDHLRGAGFDTACTWIPIDDAVRRSFLESAGWGPDGAFRDLDAEGTTIRQVRLVTDIALP